MAWWRGFLDGERGDLLRWVMPRMEKEYFSARWRSGARRVRMVFWWVQSWVPRKAGRGSRMRRRREDWARNMRMAVTSWGSALGDLGRRIFSVGLGRMWRKL